MIRVEKKDYDITVYKNKEEAAITLEALKAYKKQISENEPGNFIDVTEDVEAIRVTVDGLINEYELIKW